MVSSPLSKRIRSIGPIMKIGTHDGVFHCDDVLACFMLKQLPEFADAEIVRSRDPKLLDECDIVVDVGGVFDAGQKRFDHHQRGFETTLGDVLPEHAATFSRTKLSSAGLVYAHYGLDVLKAIIAKNISDSNLQTLFTKIYQSFLEEVDAVDNGINQFDGEGRYEVTTTLARRVGNHNPPWNFPNVDSEMRLKHFHKAMVYAGSEFTDRVLYLNDAWIPARSFVETAIKSRFEIDSSGSIILFPNGGLPWKEHLYNLEQELNIPDSQIKYALFQDTGGSWRVAGVNVEKGSFKLRLPLPESWRGLRDSELSSESDIPDGIFVHISGFIGGNKTKEGALAMARKSLSIAVA